MIEKNIQKYNSYKNTYDQIKLAIDNGFFLEAITLEESILTDRIFRFCRDHGYTRSFDRATLGHELIYIRDKLLNQKEQFGFSFLADLEEFWSNRNTCLHQIVKSEPGKPTKDFFKMIQLAKKTAIFGKNLAYKVSKWSEKYKSSGKIE